MALEQPNNQPQPMAQRPPVGDGGEAMPNQGDSMPNQQEQEQGQNQEQQIQEFQQRVQQLPPQEKQVLAQSLTPDFRNITVKVFGSEINIFLIYWNLVSKRRNQLLNLCHSPNRQWLKGKEKDLQTGHPNNHRVGEWFNDHNPSSSAPTLGDLLSTAPNRRIKWKKKN